MSEKVFYSTSFYSYDLRLDNKQKLAKSYIIPIVIMLCALVISTEGPQSGPKWRNLFKKISRLRFATLEMTPISALIMHNWYYSLLVLSIVNLVTPNIDSNNMLNILRFLILSRLYENYQLPLKCESIYLFCVQLPHYNR